MHKLRECVILKNFDFKGEEKEREKEKKDKKEKKLS
jgi:hypothetical protein